MTAWLRERLDWDISPITDRVACVRGVRRELPAKGRREAGRLAELVMDSPSKT